MQSRPNTVSKQGFPSNEKAGVASGENSSKTLRQLHAEEDDEERFQADLQQAVRQSLVLWKMNNIKMRNFQIVTEMKKAQEMAWKMSGTTSEILKNWKSLLYHLAKASGFMYINFSSISLYVLEFMYSNFILVTLNGRLSFPRRYG